MKSKLLELELRRTELPCSMPWAPACACWPATFQRIAKSSKTPVFVFKHGDVPDLQRMLDLLLSDARLRELAGGSAQQWARHHYLWGKVTKEIAAVYADLVPPPKTTPRRAIEADNRRVA